MPSSDIPIDIDFCPDDSGVIDLHALLAEQRSNEAAGICRPLVEHAPPLVAPARSAWPSRSGFLAWSASVAVFALSAIVYAAAMPRGEAPADDGAPTLAKHELSTGGMTPIRTSVGPVALLEPAAVAPEPAVAPAPAVAEPATMAPPSRVSRRSARVPEQPTRAPERVAPAHSWSAGSSDSGEALDPSIDQLLDRALGGASPDPRLTEAALPATPTRRQVSTTLRALEGEVRECVESGTVRVRLVVDGSTGRVTSVTVGGELAGTSAARCVGETVRTARFPRFERERFVIDYPYVR